MPYVSLELEVRPLVAPGLIFHLGQTQATPSVQLQVLTEQVSRAMVLGHSFTVASGGQNLTVLHPRSCCELAMGQESSPRGFPTPSFVMDGGIEWQVRGPFSFSAEKGGL